MCVRERGGTHFDERPALAASCSATLSLAEYPPRASRVQHRSVTHVKSIKDTSSIIVHVHYTVIYHSYIYHRYTSQSLENEWLRQSDNEAPLEPPCKLSIHMDSSKTTTRVWYDSLVGWGSKVTFPGSSQWCTPPDTLYTQFIPSMHWGVGGSCLGTSLPIRVASLHLSSTFNSMLLCCFAGLYLCTVVRLLFH